MSQALRAIIRYEDCICSTYDSKNVKLKDEFNAYDVGTTTLAEMSVVLSHLSDSRSDNLVSFA